MENLYTLSEKLTLLINITENTIENIRKQHFWKTAHHIKNLTVILDEYLTLSEKVFDKNTRISIAENLKEILTVQSSSDYVLLGDLLEMKLLPSLYDMQAAVLANITLPTHNYFEDNLKLLSRKNERLASKLAHWKENTSDNARENYHIEPTNSGSLTLNKRCGDSSFYFHSNQNPWQEAETFAESCSENEIFHYTIIGFGLGYHIIKMLQKDARYQVTVLEPDIHILGCAFQYMDLSPALTEKRFQLIFSPDLQDLGKYVDARQSKLMIHYPTMMTLENKKTQNILKDYFLQMSSVEEQKQYLEENFYYNMLRKDISLDSFQEDFKNKTVIYLGGGPSTETKLPDIKAFLKVTPDTVTICAGKVYRMLLAQGFVPDYVIITDAKPGLSWQLRDIHKTLSKLLYLSTASRDAVNAFCGETIIFFQKDVKDSEDFANANGLTLFETGGSVSTAAVDIALRLGCKSLITTGLDLAYPENKSHAFGISGNVTAHASYIHATDIYGNDIITSPAFRTYRRWIEHRILQAGNINCLNITDGILIQGMDNRTSL